jgi:hypothetical protein
MGSPHRLPRSLDAAGCLAAAALIGCGSPGALRGEDGSGGASASGATAGSGADGSSGVTGSGAAPATGGSAATGGAGGSGGVAGAGGSSSTGGAGGDSGGSGGGNTAAGGVAGSAGSAGNGGGGAGNGGAGGTPSTCPTAVPLTGGQEYCSNSKGNASNGYGYELWSSGIGLGCMTVRGVDATFGATWSDVEDFLARAGLDFDQTRTHSQIGTISADFAETKADDGGLTYIGIYGWTVNPLREFYILDDWGSTKPGGTASDGNPRTFAGTLTADGETYDVWTYLRENKPAITGDSETFEQYFSIRQTARQCGHISVSQHFAAWEGLGLPLGNLHEVKLLVEAQANTGSIEFTTATVVVE